MKARVAFRSPVPYKVPCSTSVWESSETRSDIAWSSPAERQFSYWTAEIWPSTVSAALPSSATRFASGDPVRWSVTAFLRDFGGLFRKNLFCGERASWDNRLDFLDWLIWQQLAMGRKQRRKCCEMKWSMCACYSLWRFKGSTIWHLKQSCECRKTIVSFIAITAEEQSDAVQHSSDVIIGFHASRAVDVKIPLW